MAKNQRGATSNRGGARRRARGDNRRTTDHDEIRAFAEARGGHPSRVRGTEKGPGAGLLRLDFPGGRGADQLEEISWEEFFETFDDNGLELIYQERTASGRPSRFAKFVRRAER
jgi:hypothetical protein